MLALRGLPMEKWLCLGSLGVAGVLLLVFLLDLLVGMPFSSGVPEGTSSPFFLVDLAGIVGSGIVGYLAFSALKDQR